MYRGLPLNHKSDPLRFGAPKGLLHEPNIMLWKESESGTVLIDCTLELSGCAGYPD